MFFTLSDTWFHDIDAADGLFLCAEPRDVLQIFDLLHRN